MMMGNTMMNSKKKSSSTRGNNNDFDATTLSTLRVALQSNRELQLTIRIQLQKIARQKAFNRSKVAEQFPKLVEAARRRSSNSNSSTTTITTQTDVDEQRRAGYKRKWTPTFFIDHNGTTPKPNADTIRKLERQRNLQSTFIPWSKKESQALLDIIKQLHPQQQQSQPSSANDESSATMIIDYEQVAQKLLELKQQQQQQSSSSSKKKKKGSTATATSTTGCIIKRTISECRIHHEKLIRDCTERAPFTKKESLRITELVEQQQQQQSQTQSGTNPCGCDWEYIANAVNSMNSGSSTETDNNNNNKIKRTIWECIVHYQTKLKKPTTKWTVEQDQLLFKYIAAAGPQFVVDVNSVRQMMQCLDLPSGISAARINARIHQSLLNPNIKHDAWNDEEERSLAILMKIYRDVKPNPLNMVSRHLPRAPKSVADKWHRSLNPIYSSKPFTKQEDAKLLEVMQQHNNTIGWKELSQKYFPDRHPQRLASRFAEVASDQQVLSQAAGAASAAAGAAAAV